MVSTVIGVVADTHQQSLESAARPEITKPMVDFTQLTLAIRSDFEPGELVVRVKDQIRSIDKSLPIFEVRTMEQILDEDTSQRRFQSFVITTFAALALFLAWIGLFSVLAALVSQRTQEIGVRMALGARRTDVFRMVLSEAFRMVALGLILGLGSAAALSRYLATLFFGVSATSAATYLGVAVGMIAVALIASLLPAWRAVQVNPVTALRCE